ncbi:MULTISPECIES: IS3 family transposase [Eubacteriales]
MKPLSGWSPADYIDFYNHERPQSRLKGNAPIEYLNKCA